MSSMQQLLAIGGPVSTRRPPGRPDYRHLRGTDLKWTVAFVSPYILVLFAFVVYPFAYAIWMARAPSLYFDLISDPLYFQTVVNTLIFVGLGVNIMMFLALLLSGFFMRRRWWIRMIFAFYLLPWLVAAAQACVSFHWMLIGDRGLVDGVIWMVFGVDGPDWLVNRWLAVGSNVTVYVWKWMPFWTIIFLAGRMTIPRDLYDAAKIDGANSVTRFFHITVPLIANLYLVCTLLSALWALGDFTTVYLVSGGGPAMSSDVLATLGFHYAFDSNSPALGVAVMMSVLPVIVPLMVLLLRRVRTSGVQL